MTLTRNKKTPLLIIVFLLYFLSLHFFKAKYISIYHEDPLSFHLSCEIQKYRYKVYLEGIDGDHPEETKHFVDNSLRPLLDHLSEESVCDSINIIGYDKLYTALMSYYDKFLVTKISKKQFKLELQKNGALSMVEGSPNIFIWDSDFWYFSVVTATTTGYGDIVPRSEKARDWVIFQIIFSMIIAGLIFVVMGLKFGKK